MVGITPAGPEGPRTLTPATPATPAFHGRSALHRATVRSCTAAVTGLSCLALVLPAGAASADPTPTPTPSPSATSPTAPAATGSPTGVVPGGVSDSQLANARKKATAKAAQVQALQAQYAVAAAKLQAVQNTAEIAAEKYNAATTLLQQRSNASTGADARAAAAVMAAQAAQAAVGSLAAHSYIDGGNLGDLEPFLVKGGPQEMLDRTSMLGTVSTIRSQGLQRAQAAKAVAAMLQRQAALAKGQQIAAVLAAKTAQDAAQKAADDAAAQSKAIKSRQDAMVVELAALRQVSLALQQKQQAALLAASQRQVAASAAALYAARTTPAADAKIAGTSHVAKAIAFARAQIGKWYLWGGAGPDRFDCSGLTMRAWQQEGVTLGHYTGDQYASTKHVPIADRQPGDLIFYGPDVPGIHHVGLYLGNDMMIEAPHTGAKVRYANIWRSDIILTLGRP